jgi:hypothetical protein
MGRVHWKRLELAALVLHALGFYLVVVSRSLRLSQGTSTSSLTLRPSQRARAPLLSPPLRGCRLLWEALRLARGVICRPSEREQTSAVFLSVFRIV